jgi:L-rhamnose-H+ transport protein
MLNCCMEGKTAMRFGLCAVLLGGVLQGSVLLPMKLTRRWQWENTWACFSIVAYLLSPWFLAFLLVPHFPQMLGDVSPRVLITTLLFGAGMGAGALMMGLAYRYVGMAITFAIVLGISSSVGTLVPMTVLAPDQVLQHRGLAVIAGVVIALIGTAIVTWAAWERDSKNGNAKGNVESRETGSSRNVLIGLGLCIASGLFSSCGNLGFAFGGQISERAREMGAGPTGAASATWSIILIPVFLCNFIYSLYLLNKNKSVRMFREPGTSFYWVWGLLMGIDWMAGMAAYGAGALSLGKLGTSMGWILFLASMIIVANILGVATGEWKGARPKTLAIMAAGIIVLMAAIIVVGTSGTGT